MRLTCCFLFLFFQGCQALENNRPTFFPIGNQEIPTGQTLTLQISAVDDDHDPLTFDILNKPTGASFRDLNNNQASFSWTPIASDAGADGGHKDHLVTFLVSDGADFSSETILITVLPGNAGTGSPVFITAFDHTLDLYESDHLRFRIEVRDADSAQVSLEMLDPIYGADFQATPGSKVAWFDWAPTENQITQPVWSFRVSASDHINPAVIQLFTILIQNHPDSCEGTPPTIQHDPLTDQTGPDDYPIVVQATDLESEIVSVVAYYKLGQAGPPDDRMEKLPLTRAADGSWQAAIPNPQLPGEETLDIIYYLCAIDDDDPYGEHCDLQHCIPEDNRFSFKAHAPQDPTCPDDLYEENDTSQTATLMAPGHYSDLRSCSESDWYWLDLHQGDSLEVLLNFDHHQADLNLYLFDYQSSTEGPHTCQTALACAETQTNDEYLTLPQIPYDGPYFLLIRPSQDSTANYDMTISVAAPN